MITTNKMEGGKFNIIPTARPIEEKPAEKKPGEKMMTKICSRCHREYGQVASEGGGVTHGYCPDCMYFVKIDLEHHKMELRDRKEREEKEEKPVRYCSGCGAKIGEKIMCDVCGAKNN